MDRKLSFQQQALTLGYSSEEEMFKDLYCIQGFSLTEIAEIVGIAQWVVRKRLMDMKVPLRPRGGRNNEGNRKLAEVPTNELMNLTISQLVVRHKVHPSTIFSERRRRRKLEQNGTQDLAKRQNPAA